MEILYRFVDLIRFLCCVFGILIVVRAVMSWFSLRPTNVLVIYLHRVTEPLLSPLRRIVPRTGIVDLSPLAAMLLLYLLFWILGLLY